MKNKSKKGFIKSVARESALILLEEAQKAFEDGNPQRASFYITMLLKLLKHHNIRLERKQKLQFCKKCFSYWAPGKSVKVKFDARQNTVVFECMVCGAIRRIRHA